MFYTGVDSAGNQSIGYRTIATIDSTGNIWSAARTQVLDVNDIGWAYKQTPHQFRDPFVMPDPESPGRFLMFYVAQDSGGLISTS